ncbi:diacylglycerol/lipid kinase family protein [Acholeplasma hippikon]|uniref:Diacylglycerol kinase n=1 Tax=Acholeplasma hippikon TaxID=264636 RepID=A0A449BL19_9MOLU|nr:YegS/Rv2252/BmrU family lipid kinase [Acholeplasma hippikon]VEU83122.1 Diacylglycerol kinase [Acholeplasma hippikon]
MKTLLIFNRKSGKGKIKKDLYYIKDFFASKNKVLDLLELTSEVDIVKEVEIIGASYETIIISGGDGTIHGVVNGVMKINKELRPKLLFLPYGTTNDMAHMLGISKNIKKSLKTYEENVCRMMDVHLANDEYFIYAAAVGKFSRVSYEIDRRTLRYLGHFGYFLNVFKDVFVPFKIDAKIITKDETYEKKTFFMIMGAGDRIAGFRLTKFGKATKLNSGLVGFRVFNRRHFLSWIKIGWFYLFKGKHFKSDLHLDTDEVKVEIDDKYVWNIDGEKGPKGSLTVKVFKEEICIIVKKEKTQIYF